MADQQDLGMSRPAMPDRQWARMQPVQIVASKERLDAPHQTVTIRNTSRETNHIVIDRHMVGHHLSPGEEKHDIEMLVSEIESFVRQRAPGRTDSFGAPLPPHPIEIVGIKQRHLSQDDPEEALKAGAKRKG